MNVTDMAEQIASKHGVEKKQARQLVEGVFKAVVEAAQKGEEVSIPGFGKFKVASREARQGRNPATGEEITIGPKPASVDIRARALAKAKSALPTVQTAKKRLAA